MNSELSYRFFNRLENDQFSLIYMGGFDDEITASLLCINETSTKAPNIFTKKLSFIIVECFQNILRHADKPDIINRTNNKPKMILVRSRGHEFYIGSTNLIANTKTEGLTSKLRSINTLSQKELKAAYIDALENNEFSDKGGAGLGLIEMARKSGFPLEFDFDYINYFFSNFFMQFRAVSSDKDDSTPAISIANTKELYNELLADNILMIRKGDFSQKSILPILTMIENNLNSGPNILGARKKIVYLLVEMLQNISKHASEQKGIREGILIIAVENNKYVINTGNYIDINNIEALKENLDSIVSMDQIGLSEIYKKKMFDKQDALAGNVGIGLIEINKYSSEKLKYNFKPVTDTLSFFSLSITV